MLRFIKLSEILEETIKEVSKDDVNKFTCYKCKCTDINKLYVLRVDKPIGNGQSEYVSDCFVRIVAHLICLRNLGTHTIYKKNAVW